MQIKKTNRNGIKNVLVKMPENDIEFIAAIEALRQSIITVPYSVNFDVLIEKKDHKELLEVSGLVNNIYPYEPNKIMDKDKLFAKYHVVHTVEPKYEDGVKYGQLEKEHKEEELRKFLGEDHNQQVPLNPHSMLAVSIYNLSDAITNYSFDITDNIDINYLKPYIRVDKRTRSLIIDKLKTTIVARDKEPVNKDKYLVFAIPKDSTEEDRDIIYNLGGLTNLACIYIESDGSIWHSQEKLNMLQQVALIENPNCLAVFGKDWRIYASWSANKPFTLQLIENEEQHIWLGIRTNKCLPWDLSRRPLKDIQEHFKSIIDFNLKDYV